MHHLPPGFAARTTRAQFHRALVEMTRTGPLSCAVPTQADGLAVTYLLCAAMDELYTRE